MVLELLLGAFGWKTLTSKYASWAADQNLLARMSRRALSVVMAERWGRDSPLSGCSRSSVEALWHTLVRSEAVKSRSSLCLIVGKPPFGDISPGTTTLFNHSLTTGRLPAEWKRANVTPIQKTPNDHKPNNYRPISVLPVIVKVMEQIIHKQLYTVISQWTIISKKQKQFISLTNSKKTGKINIQLKGESIKETDSIKYLGVTVDRDLKNGTHTSVV